MGPALRSSLEPTARSLTTLVTVTWPAGDSLTALAAMPEAGPEMLPVFELAAAVFNVIWWYARSDRRLLANTIDDAGVRSITRRFLLGLAWIGGGTLLGALLPLLGVAMFASFIIFFWLPISGEIGAARPRPVQAGEWALSRTPSSETQPRADQHTPGE